MYLRVFHTYLTRKIRNDFDLKLVKSTSSAVIITSVELLYRLENKNSIRIPIMSLLNLVMILFTPKILT